MKYVKRVVRYLVLIPLAFGLDLVYSVLKQIDGAIEKIFDTLNQWTTED